MSFNTANAIDIGGWTCSTAGSCGKLQADGVVTDAPVVGSDGYAWVSTSGADLFDPANLPAGLPDSEVTNGATFTSQLFAVPSASTKISFHFNYVTSDGSTSYTDYAWARLLDDSGNQVALLFTARTHPTENIVPGTGMPAPEANLIPPSVTINAGGPSWSPLGPSSGGCWSDGCGYSDWVAAEYTVASAGNYRLEVGVVNWGDEDFDSALAVDGLLVGGATPPPTPITPSGVTAVPTLGEWALILLGGLLAGVGASRLRRRQHG